MQTTNQSLPSTDFPLPPSVAVDRVSEFASQLGISKQLAELLDATREVFDGPVWVEVDDDPEIPDRSYFVFHVIDSGSTLENSSRWQKWYQVSEELIPKHVDKLCLTIDFGK